MPGSLSYAVGRYDDERHIFDSSAKRGLTLCGIEGFPISGDPFLLDPCEICQPEARHPLRAVWDLCDRLDQAHAAAARPRPIDPPGRTTR